MAQKLRSFQKFLFILCFITGSLYSQTTVFNEDFSTAVSATYTTAPGAIGSTAWSLSRSGSDFGARINSGTLMLSNDGSNSANASGWALASANTSSFAIPYNQVLSSNPGMVTWTFNMRQIRTNPRGFSSGNYGAAFVLAGTSGTTNVSGTGYAVILGNSGTIDPIKLVRYSAGIRTNTTMLESQTTGLTDFGNQYLSIKVTYTPSTNSWQLFVRNDGSTAFADPNTGTLTLQGTITNSTYVGSALQIIGAYWNGASAAAQTATFDNIRVAVTVPIISSLSPASRTAGSGAFTLTVNGQNFTTGTIVRWNGSNRATTYVSPTQVTAAVLASDISSSGTASVTVANGLAISNAQTFTIDVAGVPSLTTSINGLNPMNTVTGTASASQSYTISGANLNTADPVITAPANFEISLNNTTFFTSLTLPRTGNVLTGQPVTIFARLRASAPAGIYSGSITNEVSGATTKLVAVSGTVLTTQPTVQSSGISFSNVTSIGFTVNWTGGNGANRMVVIRQGAAVNATPADGTSYTASSSYGMGSDLGSGNFVVYSGSGNTVNVSNLSAATTYHIAIYEFNGAGLTENYNTVSPPTGNRTTLNAPVGWQIYTANYTNKLDFDTTVDGVNTDAFQADGLSPNSESGELNSNAWAIAGFSDGNINFGGTYLEDSDHDRGISTGGETDGGIYAYETSAGNRSLGLQPATGDFAPGTATLRFQNQTGAAVTSLSIGYKVYVFNDQPGSSTFNFSHSADNITYTSVAGLNLTSAAAADANPQWKSYYRVVTITGINIANNAYYHFRWNSAAASGTLFDGFGLDDIVLIANPTSNFASFDGTAETFIVNGNTILSNNLTVRSDVTINSGRIIMNDRTLTLSGTVNNNAAGGLRGSAASNLIVNGSVSPTLSFDQTTPGTTNLLNNLQVATQAANTVSIGNPVVINGQLNLSAGQTLNFGTNALTGNLTTIANSGTILTQNATSTPFPANKIWNGNLRLNAVSAAQTVVPGTYSNLTISTTGGASATGNITVNGDLHLPAANPSATAGALNMGTHTLFMGANASNTGIGDVTGIISRNNIANNVVYTFGHPHTSIVFPVAGTLPSSMSLKVVIGTAPAWRPGAIMRAYDFIQSGGSNTKAVIKAHYKDGELNGNIENRLVDWAYIVSSNTSIEQGRSNYDTVENFVELTNVNIGLYFAPVFDAVRLTLDESEAGVLTWNGSVSTSWTTAANWTPNATPSDNTVVYIPDAATTPNDPILNPTVLLGSLNIMPGGILSSPDNAQFTINNAGGAWINNGIYNPGAGTSRVTFTNLDATIAGNTTFNNISIASGGGLRPVSNNVMTIGGTFENNGTLLSGIIENTVIFSGTNQVIPVPGGVTAAYHNLIVSGTSAIFPSSLNIRGNLTLNQAVDFTNKTIAMTGTDLQVISGSAPLSLNNVTVNNTFGEVALAGNATIGGILNLTAGNLNVGTNTLTLGSAAVAGTADASRMIVLSATGQVRRPYSGPGSYSYPVGEKTGIAEYSPITVNVTSGTFATAFVSVSLSDMIHPNNASAQNNISRYWSVVQTGITNAVATVTANYTAADLTGAENTISAAQLVGSFNQQTNPWIKFSTFSANTLTAANVQLTATPSYFTGIKGVPFTLMISGYGSFCQNSNITLTSETVEGNTPYTYLWSAGLGTAVTATPPANNVGQNTYTLTAKDGNGLTATDTVQVTILAPSVGGFAQDQSICAGTQPSDIILTGQTGQVLYWQKSSDSNFTVAENISNITSTLTGAQIGTLTATTYFRAVVQNGTCSEVYSNVVAIQIRSTTWNGNAWSNGIPTSTTAAVFTGNYTASSNIDACSVVVTNNAAVVINSGYDVNLFGSLSVDSGSSFTLNNNANLLQQTNVANQGNIVVKRNSSALKRLDYTLWSSPVSGQNLLSFSPATNTSRFYEYNSSTNQYNSVIPASTSFAAAKGYLIRMPNNHPTFAWVWNGSFSGVPNNGNYQYSMTNGGAGFRFNLVGNPYPSPINAVSFVAQNSSAITGTLYFWRETNENTTNNAYCSWSPAGGPTGTFVTNGQPQVVNPNGIIQTGQGFFVEAVNSATDLSFNNTMRVANHANQFFRTSEEEISHRIWLNLTNASGAYCQTAFGYMPGATLDNDQSIDGRYINTGDNELYTLIYSEKFVIQGRPLPFDASDIVPVGFKAAASGEYQIAIDHVDGLFSDDQQVYLKDNELGVVHNLSESAYVFTSDAGTFDSRFEIVYSGALEVSQPDLNQQLVVYANGDEVKVNCGSMVIENVLVYDVRGRLMVESRDVNQNSTSVNVGQTNAILIVRVETDKGTFMRKIVK